MIEGKEKGLVSDYLFVDIRILRGSPREIGKAAISQG